MKQFKFFRNRASAQKEVEEVVELLKLQNNDIQKFTDLEFSLESFYKSYWEEEYRKKKNKYLQLLDITLYRHYKSNFTLTDQIGENPVYLDESHYSKKALILEKLIQQCDHILKTGDRTSILFIEDLERQLQPYLHYYELQLVSHNSQYLIDSHSPYFQYVKAAKNALKSGLTYLRHRLKYLISFLNVKSASIDLRQHFRTIVRFIIKNMDDEANRLFDYNFLSVIQINTISIYLHNGKETNHRVSNILNSKR